VRYLKRGYLTIFAQNHYRIIGTPNQSIRMKMFSKKVYFVPFKSRGSKNSYEGSSMEFAPEAYKMTGLTQVKFKKP
jgi:hypothetical protein